jgi:Golgi nucleoside diphosphatase
MVSPVESKHPSEALASYRRHVLANSGEAVAAPGDSATLHHRRLKHHKRHHHRRHTNDDDRIEHGKDSMIESSKSAATHVETSTKQQYGAAAHGLLDNDRTKEQKRHHHDRKKHRKRMKELLANPISIAEPTVHGMMIDAGSTGSRLHVYEWDPRVLTSPTQVAAALSGQAPVSVPGTESRWTDRLGPGLASFALDNLLEKTNDSAVADDGTSLDEVALVAAIADYLAPLLDFARTVLASKESRWPQFPIFLRATAGMRLLEPHQRSTVLNAVRTVLHNATYNPFYFTSDQASVLSGEEEAAYDWVGVNFLLNDEWLSNMDTAGVGAAPRVSYGALDMGGASTQISFYEPNEDIMSNLFKVPIGQTKPWNIYAHSFLLYGVNEASRRFQARLVANKTSEQRLARGIYNPCLPGGARQEVQTNIHVSISGVETLQYESGKHVSGDNGYYQAILVNENKRGDAEQCLSLARDLLHLEKNDWCEFAHRGDCSLAGIYQPKLPKQGNHEVVREFIAFSNYYKIWEFLHLPERATVAQLEQATRNACYMSRSELVEFNNGVVDESELDSYCFRSAYAFALLHDGYGFQLSDTIRATQVINGQKVGWALGAMLYEINAMPWRYEAEHENFHLDHVPSGHFSWEINFIVATVLGMIATLLLVFVRRERQLRKLYEYEPIKDVSISV